MFILHTIIIIFCPRLKWRALVDQGSSSHFTAKIILLVITHEYSTDTNK